MGIYRQMDLMKTNKKQVHVPYLAEDVLLNESNC